MAQRGSTSSTSSIPSLPDERVSSLEQGIHFAYHCKRGSEGMECCNPLLRVFSPFIGGLVALSFLHSSTAWGGFVNGLL